MFKVSQFRSANNFAISDDNKDYLHSDGAVYHRCGEYFPTKEAAQKILDKYYPEPEHEWKHGDVFRRKSGIVMIYLVTHEMGRIVYLLDYSGPAKGMIDVCLADATFLFNIKEKI